MPDFGTFLQSYEGSDPHIDPSIQPTPQVQIPKTSAGQKNSKGKQPKKREKKSKSAVEDPNDSAENDNKVFLQVPAEAFKNKQPPPPLPSDYQPVDHSNEEKELHRRAPDNNKLDLEYVDTLTEGVAMAYRMGCHPADVGEIKARRKYISIQC